ARRRGGGGEEEGRRHRPQPEGSDPQFGSDLKEGRSGEEHRQRGDGHHRHAEEQQPDLVPGPHHRERRCRKSEAGSRKPEAGSRKPEAGSRKPEAGSRKSEVGLFATELRAIARNSVAKI